MVGPGTQPDRKAYWIVVADEFQGQFYARENKFGPLQELSLLRNEIAREKLEDVVTDKAGRGFDSQGQGRHAYGNEKSDQKSQSYAVFAKNIAERVKTGKQDRKFVRLAVIAAPRFLGVLRKALEKAGLEADLTIDKEVTGRDMDFIRKLLDQHK